MLRRFVLPLLAGSALVAAAAGAQTPTPAPTATASASKEDKVLLVVHSSNAAKSLDASKVKNYYLGTLGFWEAGQRVVVYQRPEASPAGKRFFSDVMRMAPSRFRHHWQTQQLSGQGVEPETVATADIVVSRVAGKTGGIGYILESEKDAAAGNDKVRLIPVE